jgi:glycosyltransferase involved in cell wall biosynthesis
MGRRDESLKKKICLVVSSVTTVNAFLHEPIRKLGEYYDVHVVANLNPGESLGGLDGYTKALHVGIERKISPGRDLVALWKLFWLFRRYRFDLVHSVTPKAGLLAMTAAFLAGVGVRIHMFTGQVWATRDGLSRWLLKKADRLIAWLSTDTLADSISQQRFLLEEGVLSETKSGVLAHGSISGVDVSRFKPDMEARARVRNKLRLSESDVVFLFLGRLTSDKGLLDLAAAFPGIGNSEAHLLVVGPDEEQIGPQMVQLAGDSAGRIHFVGFAANPEAYLAAADVLCLPSYREGFGNVVIEAAAVGIPAIGSRIYGVVDAIAENETGMLFEVRNVRELQTCLQVLCNDRELRRRLGRQARERVLAEFTSERLADAWLDYYRARL